MKSMKLTQKIRIFPTPEQETVLWKLSEKSSLREEKIAIEIETGKSDAIYNIRKDINAGFDKVVSVALSEEVKMKLTNHLKAALKDKSDNVRVIEVRELCLDEKDSKNMG